MRRFYDDLRLLDETPSDQVLGRCFWHVAEARALAEQACTPKLCSAVGEERYERTLDRFDSLTLYLHGRAADYHRLDTRPTPGAMRWTDAYAPGSDPLPLGELLVRSQAVLRAQGGALFDFGGHVDAVSAYTAAHPSAATPYTRAEIADLSLAGRKLYADGWLEQTSGVGTMPTFSDQLVAPPPGVPIACKNAHSCGSFNVSAAQAATSFQYFEYEILLGEEAVLPLVVGLGESPGYFVQVWSNAEHRWLDLFGGREVRSAPATACRSI